MNALLCTENRNLARDVEQSLSKAGVYLLATVSKSELVPQAAEFTPQIVLLDLRSASPELLSGLRGVLPSVYVVVLTHQSDFASVRQAMRLGANDLLAYPQEIDLLPQHLRPSLPPASPGAGPRGDGSLTVAVFSGTGGAGKSFLAANLAALMQKHRPTLAIDLNLHYGTLDLLLNLPPHQTLADLLNVMDELNQSHLASAVAEHPSGLHLLCAPQKPGATISMTAQDLLNLLSVARSRYGCIVMDLPSDFSAPTRSAVSKADLLVYVVTPNLASVTVAQRTLRMLEEHGFKHRSEVLLVLNRTGSIRSITPGDVQGLLGMEPILLGEELELVEGCVTEGRLVVGGRPSRRAARLARGIEAVVARLLATM